MTGTVGTIAAASSNGLTWLGVFAMLAILGIITIGSALIRRDIRRQPFNEDED